MYTRDIDNRTETADQSDAIAVAAKSAAIAAGVVVVVELYRHRKLLAVASAFTAALMWTNKQIKNAPVSRRRQYRRIAGTPSFYGDDMSRSSQRPLDEVEEAAMESFPASDPPASHTRA